MADTPAFRTRIAARGWVSRVSSKLDNLCRDPNVNVIELSDAIAEFDIRINRLDDTQTAVELEIDLGDIENDINNAAAFRDRVRVPRVLAAQLLSSRVSAEKTITTCRLHQMGREKQSRQSCRNWNSHVSVGRSLCGLPSGNNLWQLLMITVNCQT